MRVVHSVPLIGQLRTGTCWAASIAMLLSWRKHTTVSTQYVIDHTPAPPDPSLSFSAAQVREYRLGSGLSPQQTTAALRWWGLVVPPGQTFTVEAIHRLLGRRGPLLVTSYTQRSRYSHCRVITGLDGDGTPGATNLYINDPWNDRYISAWSSEIPLEARTNPGSSYTETYNAFEGFQRAYVGSENTRLQRVAQGLPGNNPPERDWVGTLRRNTAHATEADCNYIAHC